MRITTIAAIFGILFFSFHSPASHAERKASVQTIGVQSFDQVFRKAKQMDKDLTRAERSTNRARANFNSALGLKKKSTYKVGLKELVQRAQGKVKMTMMGNSPKLSIQDAVPTKVKKGVEALNASIKANIGALRTVIRLPGEAQVIIQRAQKIPDRFRSEIANNPIKILTSIRELRTIGSNIKIIKNMPGRARTLIKSIKGDLKKIVDAFGFSWSFGQN
jgi:hypothetical protein